MPTERFYNLPKEKRQRILDAAIAEISRVPFDEVSINKIVQAAGIPRGSFYQYFDGKEDLLYDILKGYRDTIGPKLKQYLENGGDLFGVFAEAYDCTVAFGTDKGRYQFFRNIFAMLRLDAGKSLDIVRFDLEALLQEFLPYTGPNIQNHNRQELVDLLEILMVLLRRALVRVFANINEADEVRRSFLNQLQMVKYGFLGNHADGSGK